MCLINRLAGAELATANTVLVVAGLITVGVFGSVIVSVNRYAYRRIVELKDA